MAKPIILIVDDLVTSYESLVQNIAQYDGGRLAREFDYQHLDCFAAVRQWYHRNRARFVALIIQDVDFSHTTDERKLVDYPEILKPLQRTMDIKCLQGFLIYGYIRQNNIDRIAPVIFVSCRIGMESTSEFSEFIIRPGYGICSFVPESAVGEQYYPKIAAAIDALAIRPLTDEQRRNWITRHHMVIGRARKMAFLAYEIERIGPSDATVLLLGGPGVGKELVANALHRCSYRYVEGDPARAYPLAINMAALSPSLIEDELFGHQRGAFTGATGEREGILEAAQGSTVLLDEIGDVAQDTQVKLLRAMEYHRIKRIGSSHELEIDMRIIAATNRDLEHLITEQKFRTDLYYRLNVFPIHIPPLRERKTDILLLADHFVEKYSKANQKAIRRISTPAIDMMMNYHWPGNVRELENCIERAVLLSNDDVIHGHHLPPTLQTAEASGTAHKGTLQESLDNLERELLLDALKSSRGNMAKAARELCISERLMGLRVNKHGIDPSRYRSKR